MHPRTWVPFPQLFHGLWEATSIQPRISPWSIPKGVALCPGWEAPLWPCGVSKPPSCKCRSTICSILKNPFTWDDMLTNMYTEIFLKTKYTQKTLCCTPFVPKTHLRRCGFRTFHFGKAWNCIEALLLKTNEVWCWGGCRNMAIAQWLEKPFVSFSKCSAIKNTSYVFCFRVFFSHDLFTKICSTFETPAVPVCWLKFVLSLILAKCSWSKLTVSQFHPTCRSWLSRLTIVEPCEPWALRLGGLQSLTRAAKEGALSTYCKPDRATALQPAVPAGHRVGAKWSAPWADVRAKNLKLDPGIIDGGWMLMLSHFGCINHLALHSLMRAGVWDFGSFERVRMRSIKYWISSLLSLKDFWNATFTSDHVWRRLRVCTPNRKAQGLWTHARSFCSSRHFRELLEESMLKKAIAQATHCCYIISLSIIFRVGLQHQYFAIFLLLHEGGIGFKAVCVSNSRYVQNKQPSLMTFGT